MNTKIIVLFIAAICVTSIIKKTKEKTIDNNMEEEKDIDMEQKKIEYSKDVYNKTIKWIENADLKASILLAFIGVCLTLLFSTNYFLNTLEKIVISICENQGAPVDGWGLFTILALLAFGFCITMSIICLWKTLRAQTKSNNKSKSIMYYGGISEYNEVDKYKEAVDKGIENVDEGVLEQIWHCSKRCQEKYDNYNDAFCWLAIAAIGLVAFVILAITYNAIYPDPCLCS